MSIPSSKSRVVYVYFAVLLSGGLLYAISCAPGSLWQDSGLIQYRVWHGDIEGFLGLAIAHPLYYLVAMGAKLIPVGEFGYRVNLLSALAGALALANLYLLVRLWVGREFPAVIAALTLAVSHTFWRHASIAETYTLWAALFLGELVVLLLYSQRGRTAYLYALGLLNGMAIAVHMLASIPLICYSVLLVILVARKRIRPVHAACAALLWMVGAAPYGYLIVGEIIQSGDLPGTLASAAFGDRWQGDVLNAGVSWDMVKENVLYLLLNFPTPNALLLFVGCAALCRKGADRLLRAILMTLMVFFFVFAFRYTVSDRYAFFIPFYVVAAAVIGFGVDRLQRRVPHRALACLIGLLALSPVAVYAVAPSLAERCDLSIGTRGDIAHRDDHAFFLQPWKTGYRGAEQFAREVLEAVPAEALIYADTTTVAPLLYMQEVEGVRPDVKIVTGLVRSAGAPLYGEAELAESLVRCPVYVTSPRPGYCPPFILEKYDLDQCGLLWRVVQPSLAAG